MLPLLAGLLLTLAVIGLLDALYFVLVERGRLAPDTRLVPPVCRMEEQACARILHTPYARVLGLPNATYGLAWYLAVGAAAAWALSTGALPLVPWLLLASLATVVLGAYLVWALLVELETPCPLCLLGHAVNVGILGLLLAAWL